MIAKRRKKWTDEEIEESVAKEFHYADQDMCESIVSFVMWVRDDLQHEVDTAKLNYSHAQEQWSELYNETNQGRRGLR